jgi:opacity protein-like surface antigen
VNYQTPGASRDNGYTAGFTTGLGIDVAILPNVFVRAEYEYALFAPIGGVRASVNTARAGVGIRF